MTEFIGWISTLILAATISRQVYTQWKTQSVHALAFHRPARRFRRLRHLQYAAEELGVRLLERLYPADRGGRTVDLYAQ